MDNKRTWAQVNLDALAHNYHTIRAHVPAGTKVMGVVKADGYGHGAVAVSARLEAEGCEALAVSTMEEALALRAADITLPILIMGYVHPANVNTLIANNLALTVYSVAQAEALQENISDGKLTVHIEVDSGMSRLGFAWDNCEDVLQVCDMDKLDCVGLYTHLSSGDDTAFTAVQIERFTELYDKLKAQGKQFLFIHCANSLGVIYCRHAEAIFNMVRPGLALYGQNPSVLPLSLPLKPVMSLHSVAAQVKTIKAGEGISYDRSYIAPTDRRIAIVPVGYADGYPRALSNKAFAMIRGERVPIVGKVCMDMTMFDVTDVDGVCVGDGVELFGSGILIDELAEIAGTISYDIVCGIGKRVPRV